MEAEFIIQSNDQFHRISDKTKAKTGHLDSERIFFEWSDWFNKKIKELHKKEPLAC